MPINHNFSLTRVRKTLGLTQSEMAQRMGLSLRPYQKLESNTRKVRSRHVRLAESVALDVAIEKEDPELAPASVRNKAIKLARAILMQNFRQNARKLVDVIFDQGAGRSLRR
jgi:transcriptional regulator with XRE-family HTH domain